MSEYIRTNKFDMNECPMIFVKEKLIQMNVPIYIRDQYILKFEYSNIRIYSSHSASRLASLLNFLIFCHDLSLTSCEWLTACFQIWTQLRSSTPQLATPASKAGQSLAQGSKKQFLSMIIFVHMFSFAELNCSLIRDPTSSQQMTPSLPSDQATPSPRCKKLIFLTWGTLRTQKNIKQLKKMEQ